MYRTFRGAKQLGIVAGALMLSACATAAQRQYQAIATSNQSLVGQAKACVAAIYAAPEAAPLRPHITIDPRDLTLAQLSDQSLATKEEIEAIFILHPRLQQCRKGVLDGLVTTTPTIVPILAAEYIRGDDLTLLLVQRKLSWGEFSKRRRDMALDAQGQLVAEARRIEAGLQQSHEAELARRQAAMQAIGQWGQSLQNMANTNRGLGGLHCTSSRIGDFVDTNCY